MEHPSPPPVPASVLGICTALPKEHLAVYAAFHLTRDPSRIITRNGRRYDKVDITAFDGSVHELVFPQPTMMGNNRSAITSTNLLNDFPEVQDLVLVGIAGAVPHPEKVEVHVRLGDVVVLGDLGVVQFDMVKISPTETEYRHPPRPPSARLLRAAVELVQNERGGTFAIEDYLKEAPVEYARPGDESDMLHDDKKTAARVHPDDPHRRSGRPRLFIGPIGSSNALLKDYQRRDALRDKHRILAVEMESSGCADACHEAGKFFFAVRGTCDYCNEDKVDVWHEYAAFVAAAYLRCILFLVPGTARKEEPAVGLLGSFPPSEGDGGQVDIQRSSSLAQSTSTLPLLVETSTLPVSMAEVLEAANAADRVCVGETSTSTASRNMAKAEEYLARVKELDSKLDFIAADDVAKECEQWMAREAATLPSEVQTRVYAGLAHHSLGFERVEAARAGKSPGTHERTKRLLELAQQVHS
jgi:nucleoside phosphorylase